MAKVEQNDRLRRTSFLYGGNAEFIEQLYARYKTDPRSVDPGWQSFFADLTMASRAPQHRLGVRPGAGRTGLR